jgi:hypothetical protein
MVGDTPPLHIDLHCVAHNEEQIKLIVHADAIKAYEEMDVQLHSFLTSEIDWVSS